MVIVPNLDGVKDTDDVVYISGIGPITGREMIHGHNVEASPYMAHLTGFVPKTLERAMKAAGFERVKIIAMQVHNLMAVGVKT